MNETSKSMYEVCEMEQEHYGNVTMEEWGKLSVEELLSELKRMVQLEYCNTANKIILALNKKQFGVEDLVNLKETIRYVMYGDQEYFNLWNSTINTLIQTEENKLCELIDRIIKEEVDAALSIRFGSALETSVIVINNIIYYPMNGRILHVLKFGPRFVLES